MAYEDLADDVIRFADKMGIKTFTLMGYCVGGRIAAVAATRHPHRVDKLIPYETVLDDLGVFAEFPYRLIDIMDSLLKRGLTIAEA